jgi:H+-transporting ATPase
MEYCIAGKSCSIVRSVDSNRIFWVTICVGMSYLGLTGDTGPHTFVFDMLIFGSMFTILTVREKVYFWESFPSKTLVIAICGDFVMTFLIAYFGIPGLVPIPAEYILIAIIGT